jgi:hypothetical protein
MHTKSIFGSWGLASFEIENLEGQRSPWGTNARGLLIYAPTGHMSVSINKDVENDSSQSESENLFDSILFYSGTFSMEGNLIRHEVTNASNPARIGKEMLRYATMSSDGNRVELATPKESFGRAILVWKRLESLLPLKSITASVAPAILLALSTIFSAASASAGPVRVPVTFMEALAPRDTTSSESFRKEYVASINLGQKLTRNKLASCGYEIESKTHFYDASDGLQAREKATEAESERAWLIVGPRRSNHYLLVAGGAPKTPSVSIMAGSSEVEALGPLHLSIYPANKQLAQGALSAVKTELRKKALSYVSIVSEDCVVCRDFAATFDSLAAQASVKKAGETLIAGESPDLKAATEAVLKAKPDFVLVPNYSKVSSLVLGAIEKASPGLLFVGSDGWGDGKFGFVEKNPSVGSAKGLTIRGFPPTTIGLTTFPIGQTAIGTQARDSAAFLPTSGPGMAILRSFQGISDVLCDSRPKNLGEFSKAFATKGRKHFASAWGANLYRLNNGTIEFVRALP